MSTIHFKIGFKVLRQLVQTKRGKFNFRRWKDQVKKSHEPWKLEPLAYFTGKPLKTPTCQCKLLAFRKEHRNIQKAEKITFGYCQQIVLALAR